MADREQAHVVVRGSVQGVFFRGGLQERARALGVAGWVRNNPDGTVEAVFEGVRERVESLVRWCERGPAGAWVESVEVDWRPREGLRDFRIA